MIREVAEEECRVAITPGSLARLEALGFEVVVQAGAGERAGFTDEEYRERGAAIGDEATAWGADVVVMTQAPPVEAVTRLRPGALLVSLLLPAQNESLVEALAARGVSALALDRVPRITRAQKMDVLSSMANIAGYRAVLEAAAESGRFLGAQTTAAGTEPPAKVLVIGAGVAGLAAIAAARALGAEVRAFDTRLATKEQVESLGGQFLELDFDEDGEGQGGYAKAMSPEFIAAEMELFRAQAAEVDIIVTTARVPGKRAPVLLPADVVSALRPGSVVVDLAASQGGNCELTRAGEVVVEGGVKYIGHRDWESRMAPVASRFFSANVTHLLTDLAREGEFALRVDDEIVRASLVTHDGRVLEPPPPPQPTPTKPKPAPMPTRNSTAPASHAPKRAPWLGSIFALLGALLLMWMGRGAPTEFLQHFTVFALSCFIGWQVIWNVTPALHTPLMSVTNAISGIIIVGGLLQAGSGHMDLAGMLGAVAIFVASINIFGGFAVTHRMLRMFRRGDA